MVHRHFWFGLLVGLAVAYAWRMYQARKAAS